MSNSKKIKLVITIITLIVGYFFKDKIGGNTATNNNGTETSTTYKKQNIDFDFLPTSTTNQIVHHNSYSLSYNEEHEQAEWVAYSLEESDLSSTKMKRPFFIVDPKVKTKSAHWKNYKNSGYDKGHLCPAGDRKSSKKMFDETFYTSNATPQKHSFNAGIWEKLEQKTRYWAKKYGKVYVITGGILKDNLKTIGNDKVSVPEEFYKIILDYTEPEIKAIAFLFPHKESKRPLYEFVISIDQLEKRTGINFFHSLPDEIENKLEKSTSYKDWSFR